MRFPTNQTLRRVRLAALFLAASPLWAQWEAAGYIGAAHTQNSSLQIVQPLLGNNLKFENVHYRGNSFQSPLYYGGRGGYFFYKNFGIEGEFIHLKVFANVNRPVFIHGTLANLPVNQVAPLNSVVQSFSISHGVNLLLGNFVYRRRVLGAPNERPRLLIALRAGGGMTVPHPESTIFGVHEEHYQAGSPALQLAAGAELHLWRSVYWMTEYKYTCTRQHVDVVDGAAATTLNSHHIVAGIALH